MTKAQRTAMRKKAVRTEARKLGLTIGSGRSQEQATTKAAQTIRKPREWEKSPTERIARYKAQPDFWFGKPSPAQTERTGVTDVAWKAAEAHNATKAKENGVPFKRITKLSR